MHTPCMQSGGGTRTPNHGGVRLNVLTTKLSRCAPGVIRVNRILSYNIKNMTVTEPQSECDDDQHFILSLSDVNIWKMPGTIIQENGIYNQ